MAILTSEDFAAYQRANRQDRTAKDELQLLSPGVTAWHAMFQALEDAYTTERAGFKTAMETALGGSITNVLAIKMEKLWMQQKARGL